MSTCFPVWQSALSRIAAWVCRHQGLGTVKMQPTEGGDDSCPATPHARRRRGYLQPPPPTQALAHRIKILSGQLCFPFFSVLPLTWEVSYTRVALSQPPHAECGADRWNKPHLRLQPCQQTLLQKRLMWIYPIYAALSISCWGANKCLPIIIAFNQQSS